MKKHDIIFLAFASICMASALVYQAERIKRLGESVHIFSNPSQLQIHDDQDPSEFPFIVKIKCEILPCGKYTGVPRECVVSCDVMRIKKYVTSR